MINDIYPCSEFLRLKFKIDINECVFCKKEVETLEHLMFSCNVTDLFWKDFKNWLSYNNLDVPPLTYNNIKFGFIMENRKLEHNINNLILLAKYFLHKCKFSKNTPHFNIFLKELHLYCASLRLMKMKNALLLYNCLSKFSFDWSP